MKLTVTSADCLLQVDRQVWTVQFDLLKEGYILKGCADLDPKYGLGLLYWLEVTAPNGSANSTAENGWTSPWRNPLSNACPVPGPDHPLSVFSSIVEIHHSFIERHILNELNGCTFILNPCYGPRYAEAVLVRYRSGALVPLESAFRPKPPYLEEDDAELTLLIQTLTSCLALGDSNSKAMEYVEVLKKKLLAD